MNHKFEGVQALRFLAAIMVVVCHSFFYTSERLGADQLLWSIGSRGVHIFFVISGFVMILSSQKLLVNNNGGLVFLKNRFIRIVPLYWIATSVKLFMLIVAASLVLHSDLHWPSVIKSYFFIPSVNADGDMKPLLGVGWTLLFEMFFYAVFAVAMYIRRNIYITVGAFLLSVSALSAFRPENYEFWWYWADPIVLEFYFGMLIGKLVLENRLLSSNFCLILTIASLYFIFTQQNIYGIPEFIFIGIPSAVLVYSVICIEKNLKGRIPRIILFGGEASYSLYLFHPLLAPVVPVVLNKLGLLNFWLSVLICVVFSCACATVIYFALERPIVRVFQYKGLNINEPILRYVFRFKFSEIYK